ncbi:MAG: 2-amino-4-hydroxy-6-hydroxymethyldihydropteridine diphosphokinase [Coriobacteriia bacterium]|nr:2-amino-4-hydroxy-6-hydroxymethyldihydropteridine diphosphokinase [Coriobacteriia bacterium]
MTSDDQALTCTAYIGLGSNLGDRLGNLSKALYEIAGFEQTTVQAVSHAYESEPAYLSEQPNFLNAVCQICTVLEPEQLLGCLLGIEDRMGRVRTCANDPRVIDLDLLVFGECELSTERLTLPHPGITQRDFVVTPLLEIAPTLVLPGGVQLRRTDGLIGRCISDAGPIPGPHPTRGSQ